MSSPQATLDLHDTVYTAIPAPPSHVCLVTRLPPPPAGTSGGGGGVLAKVPNGVRPPSLPLRLLLLTKIVQHHSMLRYAVVLK